MKYLCNYCSKYPCTDDKHKLMFRCPEFSPKQNPMTNYDLLTSKTPEELAKWIAYETSCETCHVIHATGFECQKTTCKTAWEMWLKATADKEA